MWNPLLSPEDIENKVYQLGKILKSKSEFITKNNPNTEGVRAISITLSIIAEEIDELFDEWGHVGE